MEQHYLYMIDSMLFLADASTSSAAKSMGEMAGQIIDGFTSIGMKMYSEYLGPEMASLAYTMLFPIIITCLSLIGIKTMIGKSDPFAELGGMILRTFLVVALLFGQFPQIIIGNTMFSMEKVGRYIGAEIAQSSYWVTNASSRGSSSAVKPADAVKAIMDSAKSVMDSDSGISTVSDVPLVSLWDAWLKDGYVDNDLIGDSVAKATSNTTGENANTSAVSDYTDNGKFSNRFIRQRIFGSLSSTVTDKTGNSISNPELKYYQSQKKAMADSSAALTIQDAFSDVISGKQAQAEQQAGNDAGWLEKIARYTSAGNSLMQPLSTMGIALAMSTMMLAAIMSPPVAVMTTLGSTYFMFFLICSLAIGMIPLLYFDSFFRVWVQFIHFLISLALIPFFFHIMSGVGFAVMTTAFEIMFPQGGSGNLPTILNDMLAAGWIQSIIMQIKPITDLGGTGLSGTILDYGKMLLENAMIMMLTLGRQVVGVSIITSFILGGVTLAGTGLGLAATWPRWFAEMQLVGQLQQSMLQIQSGISSGLGSAYSQGMQTAGDMASGINSKVQGFLKK